MRNRERSVIFERAVLALLSLPLGACGGQAPPPAYDGGINHPFTPQPPAAAEADAATCAWAPAPPGSGSNDCNWFFTFTGGELACTGSATGNDFSATQCAALCGTNPEGQAPEICSVSAYETAPSFKLDCLVQGTSTCPVLNGGRRPEYFAALGFDPPPAGQELGAHFARVALLEAGSVEAFRMLRDELRAHGAPRRLVRGAERAIRDEQRHVRQTSALARRFGHEPLSPIPVPARAPRDLEALARENGVEGCVRETYSALECLWQAHAATDLVVRAAMVRIARDEMRHLELSWAVHSWAISRIGRDARRRVRDAQRNEIRTLARELGQDPAMPLIRTGGLPRGSQSRALVEVIAAEVERAAA